MDLESIRDHVYLCPLGWHDGRLLMSRRTTEGDVIKWLHELREMVGIKPPHHDWQQDSASSEHR
jgi:hypothetical protein